MLPTMRRPPAPSGNGMCDAVHEHGWDGAWFLRAYDHFGGLVGSATNEEGQIFIEPQGMCVIAGIGLEDGRAAARPRLGRRAPRDAARGGARCSPPTRRYHLELGEISSYPPGYKENGGVFCHTNPWVMIAETRVGNGDRALELPPADQPIGA